MLARFSLIGLIFLFLGCGYKPVSKVTQEVLGEKVFANVKISINDPKNTVILQDAINSALASHFGRTLVPRHLADTVLNLKIKSINFTPIVYDKNGYAISYQTKIVLLIDTKTKGRDKITYVAEGEYDFFTEANSIISDSKRFEAIKQSSINALEGYGAFIAVKGMRNGKYDK